MSAKTSTQPGRRTPLSLSGAVAKGHPNKGVNNTANGNGNTSNGTTSNANKTDNKLQQQNHDQVIANNSDIKENSTKRQPPQADKKQQVDNKKINEKNQNGVNSNKQQQPNENKQQIKEKPQQQNGNDANKVNEKDKKEKSEKSEKLDKSQEKSEKEDIKSKEQDKPENKKEETKTKEIKKDANEDKKELTIKNDAKTEQQQPIKEDVKKSKEENQIKSADKKPEDKTENMAVVEDQHTPKKATPIPVTPKSNNKTHKTSASVNKTPTKVVEKTPQKSTPTNTVKTTPAKKREETTSIGEDIEMEPLTIEGSPIKSSQPEEVPNIKIAPSATSTPGKLLLPKRNLGVPKSDVQLAMQMGLSPERPRSFSQISGRKSIRQISDYTPSKFQTNLQFRESYRRINTELDDTNTSMNVTVGSEAPNNFSFSFFGRGRKRDRTPPKESQSAIGELQTDMEVSPPKRARLDMHMFLSVVSSPLSLLRNRFSKASLESSTPVKIQQKLNTAEDEIEVQNVSGVSVHEEIAKPDKESAETNTTVNDDNDTTLGEEVKEIMLEPDVFAPIEADSQGKELKDSYGKTCEQSDIKITETPMQPVVEDLVAKNKRCMVM